MNQTSTNTTFNRDPSISPDSWSEAGVDMSDARLMDPCRLETSGSGPQGDTGDAASTGLACQNEVRSGKLTRNSVNYLACLLTSVALSACSGRKAAHEVVLYSSVDEGYTREIMRLFESGTGIRVKLVSDTEETKSTGLLNRLIAEKERPVADVFWSGDVMRAAVLKARGIAENYQSGESAGLPGIFNDPDHAFTCSSGRLRLIIRNTDLVKPDSPGPTSVLDLARPAYAGRSCMANPLFGTTSMHAAALFEEIGDEAGRRFFEDFSSNGGRMLSSNGEVRRRVAAGEFAYGLTDSDDVSVAIAEGKHVDYIIPDQMEGQFGAVLVPSAVVLIKGAPHSVQARALLDFLVSADTEKLMADGGAAQFPLRPGLDPPKTFGKKISDIRIHPLDYRILAAGIERLQNGYLREWTSKQTR